MMVLNSHPLCRPVEATTSDFCGFDPTPGRPWLDDADSQWWVSGWVQRAEWVLVNSSVSVSIQHELDKEGVGSGGSAVCTM